MFRGSDSIKTHDLRRMSTGRAYDLTQCDERIKDGDVLVVDGGRTVGFLAGAWPVRLFGDFGAFHGIEDGKDADFMAGYPGVLDAAKAAWEKYGTHAPIEEPVASEDRWLGDLSYNEGAPSEEM